MIYTQRISQAYLDGNWDELEKVLGDSSKEIEALAPLNRPTWLMSAGHWPSASPPGGTSARRGKRWKSGRSSGGIR